MAPDLPRSAALTFTKSGSVIEQLASAVAARRSWRSSAALDNGHAGGHARCWPTGWCARERTRSAPLARPPATGGRGAARRGEVIKVS